MKEPQIKYPAYVCNYCGKVTMMNDKCSCGRKMDFKVIKVKKEVADRARKIVEETKGIYFY